MEWDKLMFGSAGNGLVGYGANQDYYGTLKNGSLGYGNSTLDFTPGGITGSDMGGKFGEGFKTGETSGLLGKGGEFDMGSMVGNLKGVAGLYGGLAEMGLFGGTPESRLQEKALNEQIAASKRGFNANATSYNHQVGRADGYNARHGVGPSEKIKKI